MSPVWVERLKLAACFAVGFAVGAKAGYEAWVWRYD